jgi:hypothetical protein
MNAKHLVALGTCAALALVGATCAPVEPSADTAREGTGPARVGIHETVPPSADGVRSRVEAAIEQVKKRDLLTTNGFWTVFHGILGLGPEVTLLDPMTGRRVKALDHVCAGKELRGLQFLVTADGLDVRTGPQFVGQGHQDQFVAEMVQWGVPADRKFVVLGKDYTFMDFIRHTKARARVTQNQELSWAVLIIGQYYGTDATWTNAFGEKLRLEDLVRYELDAPMDDSGGPHGLPPLPCGGTHRLFGLSWVYHLHLAKGGRTEGIWREVAERTEHYKQMTRRWQNADGALSTSYFRGPGNAPDPALRLNTTGHILEWLGLALSDAELREPWVQNAANALALMILDGQGEALDGGSLYHAVHGLLLYYARVYDADKLGAYQPVAPLLPGSKPIKKP